MKKRFSLWHTLALLLMIGGFILSLAPIVYGTWTEQNARNEISSFRQTYVIPVENDPTDSSLSDAPAESVQIHDAKEYDAFLAYNASLSLGGQMLHGEESYEQLPEMLTAFWDEDRMLGYITIPKMGVELPIYLGASEGHLTKGAAVLGETSMPIGGVNTNCVISAHRGYRGAAFFRDIEKLEAGDEITVTTLWDVLTYRVSEIKIIDPDDIQSILIQPDRDLLTLMTCHPYRSGGKYRYLVYCEHIIPEGREQHDNS